jgi:hypothetical protein
VYPDDAKRSVFYFPPGDLVIAVTAEGAPDMHLLHARYTGSVATGDAGTTVVRSIFTVRLVMSGPSRPQIESARKVLAASVGATIELRPLPIRRIESAIVYAAADGADRGSAAAEPAQALPSGHFEESENAAPREGYWTERIYTLGLNPADAQLLSDALERGRLALSIGYAFLADGIGSAEPVLELSGSAELVAALRKQLGSSRRAPADGSANQQTEPIVVRAGAVAATADLARWPRIIRRIDINATAPPGYAALDVYCYDFNQGADPNRYETHRPYRFRVHAISLDGTAMTTPWRERTSWAELLDVTTQGDQR